MKRGERVRARWIARAGRGSSEYLCDPGASPPDAEIQRLEEILAPLAWRGSEPPWDRILVAPDGISRRPAPIRTIRARPRFSPALAVVLLFVLGGSAIVIERGWRSDAGPTVGESAARREDTGSEAPPPAPAGALGGECRRESRMVLELGTLDVWIPSGVEPLAIDTLAGTARCLAGRVHIRVGGGGDALIWVDRGLASLESGDRRVLIPQRGACRATKARGPGTPFWLAASPALIAAVDAFDRGGALGPVLEAAGVSDTLTWWHLLLHPDQTVRSQTYERVVELFGGSEGSSAAGVLSLEPAGIEFWRERLAVRW